MASVYKAYEAGLDRYVALKVLPADFLHDPTFAERFRREAKSTAKLEHPNIIPMYASGIDEGIPWMAMRLVPGGTLSSLLKKGRLDARRAIAVLAGVAAALDYAHAQGMVHRDVKPQNVLLDDAGHVYLADFGIARMVEGSPALTQTGVVTGTPQYMAPEQARADKIDHRADIYALGIVAYELFSGAVPFTADTPVAVLMKHILDPIPIPQPDRVPEPLLRALLKCLDKDPTARWPTAMAFVDALERNYAAAPAPEPPTQDLASPIAGRATAATQRPDLAPTAARPDRAARPAVTPTATLPRSPKPVEPPSVWPLVLGGTGLLLGALAIAAWLAYSWIV